MGVTPSVTRGAAHARRLLYVVNVDWFFVSHRLGIARAARDAGWDVHVAAGLTDRRAELEAEGFTVHALGLGRGRVGLWREALGLLELLRLFRRVAPTLVHLVTIKPVVFGGIAARLARVPVRVAAISGLGFVFTERGVRATLRRLLVGALYRLALGGPNVTVIFQNDADRDCLVRLAHLPAERSAMIRGSGVDLSQYTATPLPPGAPLAVMACRLVADKGVGEFVTAARQLRAAGSPARFALVGQPDPYNPRSLGEAELAGIAQEGVVEVWGQRGDMPAVLAQSQVFCLPSYYGEGVPKVLLEAAACGRAVVTTDLPGCRDAVVPGKTGLLVPPRDAHALATALARVLGDAPLAAAMGAAGRALAERDFDVRQVVARHLAIYDGQAKGLA